ncbi:hypothetical protein MIND_00708700 [Mycena indigotica]|uniref:Uncharacterized protein n=1 Tax=Mycena indigotica TaxID=2126181 RepID=A0A8H6W6T7_9AGAR|nr:uncharacterized protein MIND_00708700 [Mycena indigotica]KAF7301434.1 hypothetical protein MIND_00708700 [Mycena indigotica]
MPPSATVTAPAKIMEKSTPNVKAVVPAKRAAPVSKTVEPKKASHRAGKPIINWFQRKLAGGSSLVKPKRAETQQLPGPGRPTSIPLRPTNRVTSAPVVNKGPQKSEAARRKTISLNEEDDGELYANDLASERNSWAPTEADEDASMRPLPPSAPPSPSPSSASYVSDPRTFRSTAASTKPTTLLSIDLNGNGMAHIAQAPAARLHVRSSSTATGAGVSFSALPPSPITNTETALRIFNAVPAAATTTATSQTQQPTQSHPVPPIQAPLHTTHHPRNNPRPSSPPLDNASVLTLASSAFGMPTRAGVNTPGWSSAPPSALGDSLSHFGGSITYADAESTSHYLLGDDDVDASVRALRPRSSRRGSWESEASRWSARVQQGGAGTPSLARDGRSLWTSNSIRTGGLSGENYMYEKSDEGDDRSDIVTTSPIDEPAQPTPKFTSDPLRIPLPGSSDDLLSDNEDATPGERPSPFP